MKGQPKTTRYSSPASTWPIYSGVSRIPPPPPKLTRRLTPQALALLDRYQWLDLHKPRFLRSIPTGCSWGWYRTPCLPPMHIMTGDHRHRERYLIYLERNGRRTFEPDGKIPAAILDPIHEFLADNSNRWNVETDWGRTLLGLGLIHLIRQPPCVDIVDYAGRPEEYRVHVDFSEAMPGADWSDLRPVDIALNEGWCAIELYPEKPNWDREHFHLPAEIWGLLSWSSGQRNDF